VRSPRGCSRDRDPQLEAVRAFAGRRPERAVFYPQDEAFLVERGPIVEHWTVDEVVGLGG
jgi:hypothetical protein